MDVVRVEFDDHASGPGSEPGVIHITVFGLLISETDKVLIVCPWIADGDPTSHNSECYSIRKHKGVKVTRIKRIS